MKKLIVSVILCFAFIIVCSNVALAATNLGTLSYWYSDSNSIGRWEASSLNVHAGKLNSNGSFYFLVGLEHGCTQWEDDIGVSLSSGLNYPSARIAYYGGTVDEVNDLGIFSATSTQNGLTRITATTEGNWRYNNTTKTGKIITKTTGYILDKGRTLNQYKKTCTHELGHALGWFGHSSSTADIMYESGSSVTSLTTRDKNHLSQVY